MSNTDKHGGENSVPKGFLLLLINFFSATLVQKSNLKAKKEKQK